MILEIDMRKAITDETNSFIDRNFDNQKAVIANARDFHAMNDNRTVESAQYQQGFIGSGNVSIVAVIDGETM